MSALWAGIAQQAPNGASVTPYLLFLLLLLPFLREGTITLGSWRITITRVSPKNRRRRKG